MALTDKLTDIADAIRAKTGESDLLTLDEMPDAIASITGGGGVSKTYTLTGSLENFNKGGVLDELLTDAGVNHLAFSGITNLSNAWNSSHMLDLPFIIYTTGNACYLDGAFSWNNTVRGPYIHRPKIIGPIANLRSYNQYAHEDDADMDFTEASLNASSSLAPLNSFGWGNKKLQSLNFKTLLSASSPNTITITSAYTSGYYQYFGRESRYTEIINVPVMLGPRDTNKVFTNYDDLASFTPFLSRFTFSLDANN